MLIVVALGGNALLQRGQPQGEENLVKNVEIAIKSIASLAKEHTVILCHGNGPQVGLLALQADAYKDVKPYGLDILCAESQGMIGYLLQKGFYNELNNKLVTTVLTQVIVDADDIAFKQPTKPIGPVYTKEQADEYKKEKNWHFALDNDSFRRVVPSPKPLEIIELPLIQLLSKSRALVICAGGGGISVARDNKGSLVGIESIIDKDLTAAKMAEGLNADALVILTDVDGVYKEWGKPNSALIRSITIRELEQMSFAAGSMAPKIEAACNFIKATNKRVMIGSLRDAPKLLSGEKGTTISIS